METRKRKTKIPNKSTYASDMKMLEAEAVSEKHLANLKKIYNNKMSAKKQEMNVAYSNASSSLINSKPYTGTITTGGTAGTAGVTNIGTNSPSWTISNPSGWDYNILTASIPTPPPKKEQKFDKLSQAQAVSALLLLIQTPETHKALSALVGELHMPSKEDVLNVMQWLNEDRVFPMMATNLDAPLSAIKSISNLLRAISNEVDSIVTEGKALIVEEITK